MDFHPLVIHYPIAFLTVYATLEILRFRALGDLSEWFYIKGALLVFGELGALATVIAAYNSPALAYGDKLSEFYKTFMLISALIFGILTMGYLKWRGILDPKFAIPFALIGLFFIVVAGGLFGATLYGTHYDPYLAPIFKFLGVY